MLWHSFLTLFRGIRHISYQAGKTWKVNVENLEWYPASGMTSHIKTMLKQANRLKYAFADFIRTYSQPSKLIEFVSLSSCSNLYNNSLVEDQNSKEFNGYVVWTMITGAQLKEPWHDSVYWNLNTDWLVEWLADWLVNDVLWPFPFWYSEK